MSKSKTILVKDKIVRLREPVAMDLFDLDFSPGPQTVKNLTILASRLSGVQVNFFQTLSVKELAEVSDVIFELTNGENPNE